MRESLIPPQKENKLLPNTESIEVKHSRTETNSATGQRVDGCSPCTTVKSCFLLLCALRSTKSVTTCDLHRTFRLSDVSGAPAYVPKLDRSTLSQRHVERLHYRNITLRLTTPAQHVTSLRSSITPAAFLSSTSHHHSLSVTAHPSGSPIATRSRRIVPLLPWRRQLRSYALSYCC